ncbi:MAG TPA: hypothetical protein VMR37_00890, partial [Rhabdochlamydiaceae bacterium]|nr:hypothetical protein [Rhabdochlamydiaceae bacterium]
EMWMEPPGNEGQPLLCEFQEGEGPLDLQARKFFQENVQMVLDKVRSVFIRAGVQSQPELDAKLLRLQDVKRQASNFYRDHGGRAHKETIDEAMASACGALSLINELILTCYWNNKNPWGGECHDQLEDNLYDLFEDTTRKVLQNFEVLEPPFNLPYGRRLKESLIQSFRALINDCAAKRTETAAKTRSELSYLCLKGELFMMPIISAILRKSLNALISKPHEKIEELAKKKQTDTLEKLKAYQRALNSPSCCIDPAELKETRGFSEYVLASNKKQRERYTKVCEELLPYTALEECKKWAWEEWGFDPKELKEVLSEETSYDKKVGKYFALMIPRTEDFPDEDIGVDVPSLPDPIDYFVEKLKRRDEEAFKLFS